MTTKPPNNHLARFQELSWADQSAKTIYFHQGFEGFCNPTFLPQIMLTAALLSPIHASRGPLGPLKKGQREPKIAQYGPKMNPKRGRGATGKSSKMFLEPVWGQLGQLRAQLDLSKPISTPIRHPSCFLRAPKTTTRPPSGLFAWFLEVSWPDSSAKINDFLEFLKYFAIPPSCHRSCPPQSCWGHGPLRAQFGPSKPI